LKKGIGKKLNNKTHSRQACEKDAERVIKKKKPDCSRLRNRLFDNHTRSRTRRYFGFRNPPVNVIKQRQCDDDDNGT